MNATTSYDDLMRRREVRRELDAVLSQIRALQRTRIALERQMRDEYRAAYQKALQAIAS